MHLNNAIFINKYWKVNIKIPSYLGRAVVEARAGAREVEHVRLNTDGSRHDAVRQLVVDRRVRLQCAETPRTQPSTTETPVMQRGIYLILSFIVTIFRSKTCFIKFTSHVCPLTFVM